MSYRIFTLWIVLVFNCFHSKAQQPFNACGTDALEAYQKDNYPEIKKYNAELEKKYQSDISKFFKNSSDSICLPIIVHIIHNEGIENISDTQVLQGIENLNDAFANRNYYNPSTGVDTKIQFCLAQRDTLGNEINGILRHASVFTDMSLPGSFDGIFNIAFLNPNEYINLQIVKEACVNGDCHPAGFAGPHRIVVESQYFGSTAHNDVVVIHEMGHFLGLSHTFKGGCINNDCLKDGDKVCDTPPDNQNFEHCFSEHNSCTSDEDDLSDNNPFRPISLGGLGDQNDGNHNYMDYNFWECFDQFTQGQADRMHWVIQNRYSSLLESKVCSPPCEKTPLAFFTTLSDSIEAGTLLSFNNQSSHSSSFEWTIDEDFFSDLENPSLTFDEVGIFNITLEVWNGDEACETHVFNLEIEVYCPVEACIHYEIVEQYLYFNNCASVQEENNWLILNANNDTLYQPFSLYLDSFYVNNIDFVQLCLTSNNNICQVYECEFIDIVTDGSEICDNEKDDDDDGLVDLFDPDCPCEYDQYQAYCPLDCQIIPAGFPEIKMKMKWKSEILGHSTSNVVLGKITSDNVSILTTKTVPIDLFTQEVYIININGIDGSTNSQTRINEDIKGEIAIGADGFNVPNVFYSFYNYIKKYNSSISLDLNSEIVSNPTFSSLQLADINGDGIVELIKGTSIFNSKNGQLLFDGPLEGGCNFGSPCASSVVSVADLTSSSGLELAAGNTVYEIGITNTDGQLGNTVTPIIADSEITDGYTSIGDVNGDNELDVVVVRSSTFQDGGGIFVWDPRSGELIAKADAGESGGVAFLGNVDNDCFPEIGVAFKNELRLYKYDGSNLLQLLWQIPTSDNSGRTGGTMFDFNQDGRLEIVYRDETHLRIIDGVTGSVLDSTELGSLTGKENPIVADIDNDGEAEILIAGNTSIEEESRLYCFESANSPWAPARSVWNQYGYNPTQVNNDLTIPRYPQNPAKPLQGTENCLQETCNTPYNNFMVQATYRTQEGCLVWPNTDCLEEICNNEKDDDEDGLVDLFDPDCLCDDNSYQALCDVNCQFVPDPSFDFGMKIHWKSNSPVSYLSNTIVYKNQDQVQISMTDATDSGLPNAKYYLKTFDGNSGEIINSIMLDINSRFLAASKLNPNENTKLFTSNRLGFERFSDELLIESNSEVSNLYNSGQIHFADFNGDGNVELYKGGVIFNAENGNILFDLQENKGCGSPFFCGFSHSIAGDFLPSPGLELAAGNVVLDVEIFNEIDSTGNKFDLILADDPVKDGLTSAGDIDGDGELDVVVVRSGDHTDGGGIYVWNPRTSGLIAQGEAGNDGSVAFIGDVDGDCLPEIGVVFDNELRLYNYNGSQNLETVYVLPTTDDSGHTGMTMFDFNQDGKNEIVYRDETDLRIIEGASGVTLGSIPMKSGTSWEYPVVVDLDNDGQVEILVSGYEMDNDETHLYCIKSAGTPWAPGRSIWNQYGYNPTYVNDDMTIPRYPQNTAKALEGTENCLQQACSTPYNNFMVQATHRTQAGCFVWPAIDLSLELLDYSCIADSLEMDVVISNGADFLRVEDTICINWYYDEIDGNNFLQLYCLPIELSPGTSSDTLHFTIGLNGNSPNQILANINNLLGEDFQECNYLNNIDSIVIDLSSPTLDLGPDITKCNSEVISFNVGSGFTSYLWNDLSTDSIYTTSLSGLHFVEVTDYCGNIVRDSVEITFDNIDDIDLGTDLEICDQDSMQIVISDEYDFVHWYPADKVSCDTCITTMISSTEEFQLVVLAEKGNCVSLDSITVNILTPEEVDLNASICQGEQFQYLDSIWTQEGSYVYQHPVCDTIMNISLIVNNIDTSSIDRQICSGDSLFFNNSWLKDEGEYSTLLLNQFNCDSLVELTLVVQNHLSSSDTISICSGDSIFYENQWISNLGLNEINTLSSGGCDSTIYVELGYYQDYYIPDSLWLCTGDSVSYNNQWVYSDESYVFELKTSQGCDSTVNLMVGEYSTYDLNDSLYICSGDSIFYNNQWVLPGNDYTFSLETINGCDSIVNLIVFENNINTHIDSTWVCGGDSIIINGNWVYEDYEYQETQSTSQGCDSIHQHFVLFEELPGPPEFSINCESSLIDVSIDPAGWAILWSNGEVTPTTQYQDEQQINVTLFSPNNCEIAYEIDLPSPPNFELIPQFVDTTINLGDSISYNLNLSIENWSVLWSPSNVVSCDSCTTIVISPQELTQITVSLEHISSCAYEYSFFIQFAESLEDTFYIPNAFSPNGDNQNDIWKVFFNDGNEWTLSKGYIYDRWGNQVKSWENTSDISWNGKLNNKHLDLGVYMYYLIFEDRNGEEKEVVGNLTLLR